MDSGCEHEFGHNFEPINEESEIKHEPEFVQNGFHEYQNQEMDPFSQILHWMKRIDNRQEAIETKLDELLTKVDGLTQPRQCVTQPPMTLRVSATQSHVALNETPSYAPLSVSATRHVNAAHIPLSVSATQSPLTINATLEFERVAPPPVDNLTPFVHRLEERMLEKLAKKSNTSPNSTFLATSRQIFDAKAQERVEASFPDTKWVNVHDYISEELSIKKLAELRVSHNGQRSRICHFIMKGLFTAAQLNNNATVGAASKKMQLDPAKIAWLKKILYCLQPLKPGEDGAKSWSKVKNCINTRLAHRYSKTLTANVCNLDMERDTVKTETMQ